MILKPLRELVSLVAIFSSLLFCNTESIGQSKILLRFNKNFELTADDSAVFQRNAFIDPKEMLFHGEFKDYENGKLTQEGSYIKGLKSGIHKTYKDGHLLSSIEYFDNDFIIWELFGSNGVHLVREGTGRFTIPFIFIDYLFTQYKWTEGILNGEFQNGKRVSKWTYTPDHGKGFFEEFYKNGTFLKADARSSKLTYRAGKMDVVISKLSYEIEKLDFDTTQFVNLYQYMAKFPIQNIDSLERNIVFPGGINRLTKAIARNLRIPLEDRLVENPNTARIVVVITVDSLGSVKSKTILKGASKTFNEEALRVIGMFDNKLCPAIHAGKPFESSFSIPVTFYFP